MPREGTQEDGRDGVALTKRWLEATTFVEFPWNSYENEEMCYVDHLSKKGDAFKCFDLVGNFLGDDRQPIVVENKAVNTDNGLYAEFLEFVAIAYSSTVLEIEKYKKDKAREFMWVTTLPFNLENWPKFHTAAQVLKGLTKYPEYLDGREIDPLMAQQVADRIWVLVLNIKQERLSLTHEELMDVYRVIPRKKSTL
ncbi:hypothetical protein [Aeromicrobium ginsengisoli]|uniref:Uncharacterized protein n=1 Tax=Aeromicrobium ginsengisoli TaxID=363867 RepID=A0A5M4FEZ4_9ACTN|nr:hypothetical protein [Aeromicrobium ginsengisoli]KAA1397780.1 hypothetical protein ESP70_010565 [Aeromicrobium ginsengisoli]